MATTPLSVKLVRGALALDLNTLPFEIGDGFIPPATLVQPIVATGTSANRYGGGSLVGRTASNRAFSFPLHVEGSSEQQLRNAVSRLQFILDGAGDDNNPTYLQYRANTDTAQEPLWGQTVLLYEIVFGVVTLSPLYAVSDMRGRALPNCTVDLQIKPYALGRPQRVCSATGGIGEDQIGMADGSSRGLQVPGSTTNKNTNPVYGNATYGTGWNSGAGMTATQNTRPQFLMIPGTVNSDKLVATGAGTPVRYQTLTIGATTHTLSVYVMRADGAAVTSADCQLYFNSSLQTTAYQSVGNGVYRLTFTGTGNAGAANYGIGVVSGREVYVNGWQIEALGFATPLCWGDALGCAWTGTAHASTSTRTAAAVNLTLEDSNWNGGDWCIRWVWIAGQASGNMTTSYFWDMASTFHCRWDVGTGQFVLRDGTNQATSANKSFAAGDVLVFHAVADPAAGLVLYLNGASIATVATFTPVATPAALYIGSTTGVATPVYGTFADFTIFGYSPSATEVLNDYNNINDVAGTTLAGALRVGAIPWLWTNAGDNVITAVNGNVSGVRKYNWCVFCGIPGSAPALTELYLTHSTTSGVFGAIFLGRWRFPYFYSPDTTFYTDESGTADVGNSSGDAYLTASLGGQQYFSAALDSRSYSLVRGTEFYLFTRIKDAGANLQIAAAMFSARRTALTDYQNIAADGTMRLFKTPPLVFDFGPYVSKAGMVEAAEFDLQVNRSTGGASNVGIDFFQVMPRPLTRLQRALSDNAVMYVKNRNLVFYSASLIDEFVSVQGDVFELDPGIYNIVSHLLTDVGTAYTVTYTLTYTAAWVTPRYALL